MTDHDNTPTPASASPIELTGSIWFGSDRQSWGSQRRMALLQAIDDTGSISAGAKKIGLSYKAAWDAVDTMTNLAGEPLVVRTTGGQRGGGARLTPRAKKITALYQTLSQAHDRFISQLADLASQAAPDLDLIRHLMVQTSARNKLRGVVESVILGTTHDEVVVNIGAGTHIVANVSRSSLLELGLEPGSNVLAFIDASAIMISLAGPTSALSARNQLAGKVSRIASDDTSAEVSIELPAGVTMVSQITPESSHALALEKDRDIYAVFKASSVMLGLAT